MKRRTTLRETLADASEPASPLDDIIEKSRDDAGYPFTEPVLNSLVLLRRMKPDEWERLRGELKTMTPVRVSQLDKALDDRSRDENDTDDDDGSCCSIAEPWPEPMDGSELALSIQEFLNDYFVLPDGADVVITLWSMASYLYKLFRIFPRITVVSPEPGCGKSNLLDLLAPMLNKGIKADSMTTAVAFRVINHYEPTLLLDEADTWLPKNDELRGVLNAGHARGAKVPRCEGDDHTVKWYNAYAPAVLAAKGLGVLPDTILQRSFIITMRRKLASEQRRNIDDASYSHAKELRRKLTRWAVNNSEQLAYQRPELPDHIQNREADNWRPLFAVADLIGDDWRTDLTMAEQCIADASQVVSTESIQLMLLRHVRDIFNSHPDKNELLSADIRDDLMMIEDGPWSRMPKTNTAISPNRIAYMLRQFGVFPWPLPDGGNKRGYMLSRGLADAFARYLPPLSLDPPFQTAHPLRGGRNPPKTHFRSAPENAPTALSTAPMTGLSREERQARTNTIIRKMTEKRRSHGPLSKPQMVNGHDHHAQQAADRIRRRVLAEKGGGTMH